MSDVGYKIVETDNGDGDYPNEKFLNLSNMPLSVAQEIAKNINDYFSGNDICFYPRYWKVEKMPYKLAPRFEP